MSTEQVASLKRELAGLERERQSLYGSLVTARADLLAVQLQRDRLVATVTLALDVLTSVSTPLAYRALVRGAITELRNAVGLEC